MTVVGPDGDLRRVDREEVIRHWTTREFEKRGEATDALNNMDETALLDALMGRTSGENRPVWRPREVRWYHAVATEPQFRRLRIVHTPKGLGWDRVAPDHRVLTAARRIRDGEVTDDTSPQVDVAAICRLAADLPEGDVEDLILTGAQTTAPPHVVDGNHRATAVALSLLETGRMPDLCVYVGIVTTRPLATLLAKLRWFARGHLGGEWW